MPATSNNTPAIHRALTALQVIGQHPQGLSMQELAKHSIAPRATLYRILNTLMAREFICANPNDHSKYCLGPALTVLGRKSPQQLDLLSVAKEPMRLLANQIGETVKLITRKHLEAVTLHVSDTGLDGRVMSRVGTHMPLHIGASQRLLLAHAPANIQQLLLKKPLERRTSLTIVESAKLLASLRKLKMSDTAQGNGEGIHGVGAAATLIRGDQNAVVGALVAVYIHTGKTKIQLKSISENVEYTARKISEWRCQLME